MSKRRAIVVQNMTWHSYGVIIFDNIAINTYACKAVILSLAPRVTGNVFTHTIANGHDEIIICYDAIILSRASRGSMKATSCVSLNAWALYPDPFIQYNY